MSFAAAIFSLAVLQSTFFLAFYILLLRYDVEPGDHKWESMLARVFIAGILMTNVISIGLSTGHVNG